MGFKNTLKATKKGIKRNKLLSFSTVFVITIVFTICSIFISLSLIAREAVKYYETKAQAIVFFDKDTPEDEIMKIKENINSDYVEEIEYISQEDAFEIFKKDFEEEEDLVETITANILPPSLNIRATSVENLNKIIKDVVKEQEDNPYIDEILFFEDVMEIMQSASNAINYISIIVLPILLLVTFIIVSITIGFNVTLHKQEIEVMHIVGSEDSFIKWPFKLEGMLYGMLGGIFSSGLILIPWYLFLHLNKQSDLYLLINQTLRDFGLNFITYPDLYFILIFVGIHIGAGVLIGYISSSVSLIKNLNLKKV